MLAAFGMCTAFLHILSLVSMEVGPARDDSRWHSTVLTWKLFICFLQTWKFLLMN